MCGSKYHRILEAAKKNETETKPIEITYHCSIIDSLVDKFKEHTQFNLEKGITLDPYGVNLNIHNLKDFIKEYKIDPSVFCIYETYDASGNYEKFIRGCRGGTKKTKYEILMTNNEDVLLFPFSGFHCEYVASKTYSIKTLQNEQQYPTKWEILQYLKHCKGGWGFSCESSLLDLPFLGLQKVDKGEETFIGVVEDNGDDEMVVIDDE